jgi:hypothetical protein
MNRKCRTAAVVVALATMIVGNNHANSAAPNREKWDDKVVSTIESKTDEIKKRTDELEGRSPPGCGNTDWRGRGVARQAAIALLRVMTLLQLPDTPDIQTSQGELTPAQLASAVARTVGEAERFDGLPALEATKSLEGVGHLESLLAVCCAIKRITDGIDWQRMANAKHRREWTDVGTELATLTCPKGGSHADGSPDGDVGYPGETDQDF